MLFGVEVAGQMTFAGLAFVLMPVSGMAGDVAQGKWRMAITHQRVWVLPSVHQLRITSANSASFRPEGKA